jgi:hypothetical protein
MNVSRALAALFLAACLTAQPRLGDVTLGADSERSGALGVDGPLAVARAQIDVQARVVDTFAADVFYPLDDAGLAVPQTVPALVVIQDRGVSAERYFWLAQHVASRGYAAIVVDHFSDAPLAEIDNGMLAFDAVKRASRFNGALKNLLSNDATAVVVGHGEGGLAAQDLWVRYPTIEKLVAIGSALTPGKVRPSSEALCLSGSNDHRLFAMQDACATFPFATTAVVIGANHYVFTDGVLAAEAKDDGPLDGDATGLRQSGVEVIDAWLDANLRHDAAAMRAITGAQIPGVSF